MLTQGDYGFDLMTHGQFSPDAFQELCQQWLKGDFELIPSNTITDPEERQSIKNHIDILRVIGADNQQALETKRASMKDNCLRVNVLSSKTQLERAERHISNFNQEIEEAGNELQKITAIARFCRNLEWVHCFRDCNGRTIDILLLNGLLLREGLRPCLSDSSKLYTYSINELEPVIRSWQTEADQLKRE